MKKILFMMFMMFMMFAMVFVSCDANGHYDSMDECLDDRLTGVLGLIVFSKYIGSDITSLANQDNFSTILAGLYLQCKSDVDENYRGLENAFGLIE